MRLSKRQKKLWTIIVAIATFALVLTSLIPLFSAIFY
jgi:hypothetical protein